MDPRPAPSDPRTEATRGATKPGWVPSWRERWTAPWRILPDLLVIGAQKAGTTSLHDFLGRQPTIRMSRIKECHMLWRPNFSLQRYRAFFPLRAHCRTAGVQCVGESTPYYLFHPEAPKRAKLVDEEVRAEGRMLKAIAILRDPAERAWSHYLHACRLGLESMPFEAAIAAEEHRLQSQAGSHQHHSYVARGRYAPQLERWFATLGRERVLVIGFDELIGMDQPLRDRLREFLGLDAPLTGTMPTRNSGDGSSLPASALNALGDRFIESDRDLERLLGQPAPWRRVSGTDPTTPA